MRVERRDHRNGKTTYSVLLSLGVCAVLIPYGAAGSQAPTQARSAAGVPAKCTTQSSNGAMVLTQHNDRERTGAVLDEACLTPSSVKSGRFGLLYSWRVEGQIYAQPLYVSGVKLADGSVRNVVFVATMNNFIYAFDADGGANQRPLWRTELGPPANYDLFPMEFWFTGKYNIYPTIGITSTPVIDPETKTLFALAKVRIGPGKPRKPHKLPGWPFPTEQVVQRLHALDLATGQKRDSVEIKPSVPGRGQESTNGVVPFNPLMQLQRPGLLLANGNIYAAFASHQDKKPWHGWIVAYDSRTLKQTAVHCTSCTSQDAAAGGIWQAGAAPAADADGNIYVLTGNGTWDSTTKELGTSFLKLDRSLSVIDWFTPSHHRCLDVVDADLGSAGPLLIPNTDLLVGGGKEGVVYLLQRSNLGHLQPPGKDLATEPCDKSPINGRNPPLYSFQATPLYDEAWARKLVGAVRPDIKNWGYHHIHGSPVYWNSKSYGPVIYIWAERDSLRGFPLDIAAEIFPGTKIPNTAPFSALIGAKLSGAGMPGAALSLSANGNIDSTGIIWASLPVKKDALMAVVPGVLRAFRAVPPDSAKCRQQKRCVLDELWNSLDAKGNSNFNFAKYASPTIANGKVYLPTFSDTLNVYGLR